MNCPNCNAELPENARICSECGTQISTPSGISVEQEVGSVEGEVVGAVLGEDPAGKGGRIDVDQDIEKVEDGGAVVGAIVGAEDSHIHVGGTQEYGDVVEGDVVEGDQIQVGDISNSSAVAIGRGAQASVSQGLGGDDLVKLFAPIYQQIEARPEDPDVDKAELKETVQKIQKETAKGDAGNPNKVERWLKTVALMADDILGVTVTSLTNPAAGVAAVIRKIAQKVKEEAAET